MGLKIAAVLRYLGLVVSLAMEIRSTETAMGISCSRQKKRCHCDVVAGALVGSKTF